MGLDRPAADRLVSSNMTRPTTSRTIATLALAAFIGSLLGASGCVISRAKTEFTGTYIAPQTVRQIDEGESKASVLDLLGPPAAKIDLSGGAERWTWRWSKTRRSSDRVLLLSSTHQEVEEGGTVWVEFQDGYVTSVWSQ